MSELLVQVQQLLARASSQPLTAAQLFQILSALAISSSADLLFDSKSLWGKYLLFWYLSDLVF